MRRQDYKLQTVQDVRERAKRDAAQLVAAQRKQLEEAQAELGRRVEAVEDCRRQQVAAQQQMIEQARAGLEAHRLLAHRMHLADLRQMETSLVAAVEQQRLAVARAEGELEKATAKLIEAARELQVIERHRETWQQQQSLEQERREQKLNDEVGLILHQRNSS